MLLLLLFFSPLPFSGSASWLVNLLGIILILHNEHIVISNHVNYEKTNIVVDLTASYLVLLDLSK